MIRILIVEDEMLVRMGLKSYVEKSGKDMIVVAALDNAQDAISYCSKNPVDIVLTDIQMSGMDGIDLVKILKDRYSPIGVIVVSCHENFSYLRRAVTYGADKYLLKQEICKDELVASISEVYGKIALQKAENLNKKVSTLPAQGGNISASGELTVNDGQQYVIGALDFKKIYDNQYQILQQHYNLEMIRAASDEILTRYAAGQSYISKDSGLFCIMLFPETESVIHIMEKITVIYRALHDNLYQYFNKDFFLAIDKPRTQMQEIHDSYRLAREHLLRSFYCDAGCLLEPLEMASLEDNALMTQIEFSDFSDQWFKDTCDIIHAFFEKARKLYIRPLDIKSEVNRLLISLEDYLVSSCNLSVKEIFGDDRTISYKTVDLIDSDHILREWLKDCIKKPVDYFRKFRLEHGLYAKIKNYIDGNYAEKIVLGKVAKHFHVNETYLSSLFKKNNGESFTAYVNSVKILHVKRMLATTDYSLEEIAEALNFNNANYLMRVFKKVTGETIGEYKKRVL